MLHVGYLTNDKSDKNDKTETKLKERDRMKKWTCLRISKTYRSITK